jgi:hypothetical protein
MIATRLAILAVAATLVLAVLGATATDVQPSAQRVAVTAVIALIAPLFWPGKAATRVGTALRIAVWSSAAALLAGVALLVAGGPGHTLARTATACVGLFLILLVTHSVAAGLEGLVHTRAGDAEGAREMAGRTAATALAILGSLPLWFGPAAELLANREEWILDAVVGVSPLTHLAVASGNDLLRNQWFYQHSNLAALRYSYPGLTTLTASYVAIALTLLLVPQVARGPGRPTDSTVTTHPTTEHAK